MTATTRQALRAELAGNEWLDAALDRVAAEPASIAVLVPAAGRHCGRDELAGLPGWRADDAARLLLLAALPRRGSELATEVTEIYRYGDADEKRAVLLALPYLDVGIDCVELLRDALRTNDTRLVAAALGRYAEHLDDPAWRHGVLKCVFMGVPLNSVHRLAGRADAELARMLGDLATERYAAGRTMPDDATALLRRLRQDAG
ncbi:MAG: EboA domain-containing protein [Sporichthyaceae bacterium]|nr:EboA domain-containing protein [Sporichthyaceae bacterium]